MPDSKITALTSISTSTDPANDPLVIVDVSDTSMAATGTTKKVTLNQLLGASGTATLASATITGDLTVDTSTLKVDSANNRVGIGTASPGKRCEINQSANAITTIGAGEILRLIGDDGNVVSRVTEVGFGTGPTGATFAPVVIGAVNTSISGFGTKDFYVATRAGIADVAPLERYKIDSTGVATWSNVGGVAGTAMTLNSTGLGVGASPAQKLTVAGSAEITGGVVGQGALIGRDGSSGGANYGSNTGNTSLNAPAGGSVRFNVNNGTFAGVFDANANLGIGVTPYASWPATSRALQLGASSAIEGRTNDGSRSAVYTNSVWNGTNLIYQNTAAASYYLQSSGVHSWHNAASGTAGNAITFTQAMTLDASGNLLVGTASGSSHNLRKQGTTVEGDTHLNVGNAEHLFFACSSVTYNAAAAAYKITRNSSTLRSINAGGTINASGADYAEYMTKASDFVLSKGGIAGIDTNGKLTNVFADAVSFVVKSTDPSYVGNDKWGVDLEGDALEAARQLVDRIAFAGQVPVNVTGAKAGDYIVPVVDGTGIKGIAVSRPTFEQYQSAVGKVIAIDSDGRARIIVKVA